MVDSGSTHTSAVPVHDGYVLQHAIVKSPLGADFLTGQCTQFLNDSGTELVPPYMIKEKKEVPEGQKPQWTKKSALPEVSKQINNSKYFSENQMDKHDKRLYKGRDFYFRDLL